jgi:hypothetical protein
VEVSRPNLAQAYFGWHSSPTGKLASNGDKIDCVVDVINQVAAELGVPQLGAEEQGQITGAKPESSSRRLSDRSLPTAPRAVCL